MISFGGGYPNPSTFAFAQIDVAFSDGSKASVDGDDMSSACQYGPTDCDAALRPLLIEWHKHKDGVTLKPDQIQVLNGSQEGLHIAGYLFLNHGDAVALSEPAYPGALGAFRAFTNNFVSFPIDEHGSNTTALEQILSDRVDRGEPIPKLLYEVPNGHNPAGVALSLDRRHHLLKIASRFDILIIEDDPYQLVKLDDRPPLPTLQSLGAENTDTENRVIRLDSFSKIFAPGLRVGYASGPATFIRLFELYKQTTNLHTSSMVQMLLTKYMKSHPPDEFRARIKTNCELYRRNRDAMVRAAKEFLPSSVKFHVPTEGMFIWFRLPEGLDAQHMVENDGLELGILLVPGSAFSSCGGLSNCMRASFSMIDADAVVEGMRRFGTMVHRHLHVAKPGGEKPVPKSGA